MTKNPEAHGRGQERITAEMPVRVAGGVGVTRNVSVGGIYFEMDNPGGVGGEISFEIDLETPQGRLKVKCSGQVLRTESKGGRTGVAVRVTDSKLESVD